MNATLRQACMKGIVYKLAFLGLARMSIYDLLTLRKLAIEGRVEGTAGSPKEADRAVKQGVEESAGRDGK